MTFRKHSPRWALWVFAAALLLKSAMPFLANASAQMQGKLLVEVCTVYGVSLVAVDGGHQPQAPDHDASKAGDHCALTALTALATPGPAQASPLLSPSQATDPPRAHPSPQAPDACATWVARLKHGPPSLS